MSRRPHRLLRQYLRSFLVAVLLAASAQHLVAQRYTYRQYGQQQGLTNLVVYSLLQDGQGYVWVGTDNGLFRYDGTSFHGYFVEDGLPSQIVRSLALSPTGELWAATHTGIARFHDGRFVSVDTGSTPLTTSIAPAFDAAGRAYVVWTTGLARRDAGNPTASFRLAASGRITGLYASRDGVWFGRDQDVYQLNGDTAEPIGRRAGLPADNWTGITRDVHGALWVRSATRLFMLAKGGVRFVDRSEGIPACTAGRCSLIPDPREGVLVPSDTGLAVAGVSNPVAIDSTHGLSVQTIRTALVTRDGSLWLGTFGAGLVRRLGRGEWISWQREDGLPHNTVWSIRSDAQGRNWVSTSAGLAVLDAKGKAIRTWTRKDGLPGDRTEGIAAAPDGGIYVVAKPMGIAHFDSSGNLAWVAQRETGLTGTSISALVLGPGRRLWAMTERGLFRSAPLDPASPISRPHFEEVSLEPAVPASESILGVNFDSTGAPLVGTTGGLARFSNGRWRVFGKADGLLSASVVTAAERDGVYWLRYYDSIGITRMRILGDRIELKHFRKADGLSSDAIFGLTFDQRGRLWTTGDNGVNLYENGRWRHFGVEDGMISGDCDEGALQVAANGVWIGTSNGVAVYQEPYSLPQGPPRLELTSVIGGAQPRQLGQKPSLDYSHRSLRVQFGSLDFFNEGSLRFRYRLAGEDSSWIETRENSVSYAGLPPGQHRFEVIAGRDGIWSVDPVALEFSISAPWWQTWWFRCAALLALGLAAKAVWRIRHRMLLAQKAALEKEVAERTAQLRESHRKLEEIAYLDSLTQLSNRRMFTQEFDRRLVHASRYRESFAVFIVDLDRFKPVNDTYGHHAGDAVLVEAARRLRESVREVDCVARLGGDEFGILLTRVDEDGAVDSICHRISRNFATPVTIAGNAIEIGVSIGVAVYPDNGWDQETLYRAADAALYSAKRRAVGEDCWCFAGRELPTP